MKRQEKGAKTGPRLYGDGRKAVIAHRDEIRAWLETGSPLSRYWRENQDRLGGVSYTQLTRHVRRYVLLETKGQSNDSTSSITNPTSSGQAAHPPVPAAPGAPRVFRHDSGDDNDLI